MKYRASILFRQGPDLCLVNLRTDIVYRRYIAQKRILLWKVKLVQWWKFGAILQFISFA